jgi:hypothetical protein
LGKLLTVIAFNVKTDNKQTYADGIIPFANIDKPDADIKNLVDKDVTVITQNKITVIIDYPLTNAYKFTTTSPKGFTRQALLLAISNQYHQVYDQEEQTATVKTIPENARGLRQVRNSTNGKYGIWGHDLDDIVLADILVYQNAAGEIVLALDIQS